MRFLLVFLFLLVCPLSAQTGGAYVICSGGPALRKWEEYRMSNDRHDRYWGNFITAARIRMEQLRAERGAAVNLVWLVYRPGYVSRQIEDRKKKPQYICDMGLIEAAAAKVNARIIWFSSTSEFIGFMNSHKGSRRMTGFEFFGHSNKYCFLFDYSCELLGCSTTYLHQKHLNQLSSGIFTKDALVRSWGCHTGESMSAAWKKATGHAMWGATGKTDFTTIKDNKTLPTIIGGRWTQ